MSMSKQRGGATVTAETSDLIKARIKIEEIIALSVSTIAPSRGLIVMKLRSGKMTRLLHTSIVAQTIVCHCKHLLSKIEKGLESRSF